MVLAHCLKGICLGMIPGPSDVSANPVDVPAVLKNTLPLCSMFLHGYSLQQAINVLLLRLRVWDVFSGGETANPPRHGIPINTADNMAQYNSSTTSRTSLIDSHRMRHACINIAEG